MQTYMTNNGNDQHYCFDVPTDVQQSREALNAEMNRAAWLGHKLDQILFLLKDANALALLTRKPEVFNNSKFIEYMTDCLEQQSKQIAEEERRKKEAERAEARRVIHGMTKSQKQTLMEELQKQ